MSPQTPIQILEQAISDCGYWRHWACDENSLQLEFGGTQIYTEPIDPSSPPSGLVAIRLVAPVVALALTRSKYECDTPIDWFDQLGADLIDPFNIDHELFTLTDRSKASEMVETAASERWVFGDSSSLSDSQSLPFIAFWAQNVGFIAAAKSVSYFTMAGELKERDIGPKVSRWWEYWREYWERKDTNIPLPQDYACEITIPLG